MALYIRLFSSLILLSFSFLMHCDQRPFPGIYDSFSDLCEKDMI